MSAAASGLRVGIVGNGRAGGSFAIALRSVGCEVLGPFTRADDFTDLGDRCDVVMLTVSDSAIRTVAEQLASSDAVVLHVSGATGLNVLSDHQRAGSLHPLMTLPDAESGARTLQMGITFAVAGDAAASDLAHALDGTVVVVPDDQRPAYHAAACLAANHSVALWGQIERIAASIDVPPSMYQQLLQQSLENAAASGAANAITGPAMRGDWITLGRHLDAIDPSEHELYLTLAQAAANLNGRDLPPDLLQSNP